MTDRSPHKRRFRSVSIFWLVPNMLTIAGLGIAFNAKPIVQDAANTTLRVPYLDAILFMLGVSRQEVEAADSSDLP